MHKVRLQLPKQSQLPAAREFRMTPCSGLTPISNFCRFGGVFELRAPKTKCKHRRLGWVYMG